MSEGFQVQPTELRSNAGELMGVAGQVGQAMGAGAAVTALSPAAFGILCSFFTPPTVAMSAAALGAMAPLEAALLGNAGVVAAIAADFDVADAACAERSDAIRARL
jgi:hypothetical protein